MKSMKKIFSILMMIVILASSFLSIANRVQAAELIGTKVKLKMQNIYQFLIYKNWDNELPVSIKVTYVDGTKLPAYCLNKDRKGIDENLNEVTVESLETRQQIWRAIRNGYPFVSPATLGCANEEEAYAATQMAIYDVFYNFELDQIVPRRDDRESNVRVVLATKNIINKARNPEINKVAANKTQAKLTINEVTKDWQVDASNKNYISKTYSVTASATNQTYQVALDYTSQNKWKLVGEDNKEKTSFKNNEKFKVMIPIIDLNKDGKFKISVTSELETYPVYFGNSKNEEYQNFAIAKSKYETASASIMETYKENKTVLEVKKKDGDNNKLLDGATFNLLDENKKIIYSELTTKNGSVSIDHLLPGTYYLEETKAPNGYYGSEELTKVLVKFQEKVVVEVDNYKQQEEKPEDKPQEETHIPVETKKLPKTGF